MQAWARELRYAEARRLAGDGLIAVGHTATDQLETLIYRLAASPGRRALLGMTSDRVWRPLLDMTREETAAYCRAHDLPWREDSSNPASARGLIRDTILPALRQLHPAAEANMLATLAQLREEGEALDALVDAALGGEWSQKAAERPFATTAGDEAAAGGATARRGEVAGRAAQGDEAAAGGADGVNVAALPPAVARLVLQRLADDAAGGAAASLATHAEAIVALAAKPGTASLDLPGGLRAISEYGRVRIESPAADHRADARAAARFPAASRSVPACWCPSGDHSRSPTERSPRTRSRPRWRSAPGVRATGCARSGSAAASRCRTCSPTARSHARRATGCPWCSPTGRSRGCPGWRRASDSGSDRTPSDGCGSPGS